MDKPTIFIVEDNLGDVVLIRESLKENHVDCLLSVANSGDTALKYVNNIAEQHPALVILDLNIPKVSGLDILKRLRSDHEWNNTPIVIFSSSDAPQDKEAATALGATMYIQKPSTLDGIIAVGETFKKIIEKGMMTAAGIATV